MKSEAQTGMVRRHTVPAIVMHWFNALCWLFLLATGLALLAGDMQPVGTWWAGLWKALCGGARGLLVAHLAVGTLWCAGSALYIVLRLRRDVLPFLRAITRFEGKTDLVWCWKKALWLVLGPKRTKKLGVDPALPPQGFYNAGQRMVAVIAVLASLGLAVTGLIMGFASGTSTLAVSEKVLQWCIVLHFACAGIMAVFLPVHIYMAALAPGEGPAFRSMLTGFVPLEHVRSHNPLWYESMRDTACAPSDASGAPSDASGASGASDR